MENRVERRQDDKTLVPAFSPAHHTTRHGKAIRSVTTAKFLGITFDTTVSYTNHFHNTTNLPVTTFSNFYLYLHLYIDHLHLPPSDCSAFTSVHYLSTVPAATCVANPSRFVQWERLQMRIITNILNLFNSTH